jgi:hypothetical protein
VIELSIGDVTSGLARLLAAEIVKPPLLTNEKSNKTCEQYAVDSKIVLRTNRKPWSLCHLVMPLQVSDVTELVK